MFWYLLAIFRISLIPSDRASVGYYFAFYFSEAHLKNFLSLELFGAENEAMCVASHTDCPCAILLQSDILATHAMESVSHTRHCGEMFGKGVGLGDYLQTGCW